MVKHFGYPFGGCPSAASVKESGKLPYMLVVFHKGECHNVTHGTSPPTDKVFFMN